MPVNRAFIGREYPASSSYEVGREHIRRFAEAIGDHNPAYTDVAAAGMNPLAHYLQFGNYEGRAAFADGHFG